MEQKAHMPLALLDRSKSTALIEAWFEIVHLKQLFRQGWLKRDMSTDLCETVAEHSFGNAMLCLLLLNDHPELDGYQVLKLALIHDLGEAYVGDITPHDNVDRDDKIRMETEAVQLILGKLPGGQKLINDWLEYEQQSSPEARFVKQVDRLELAMQASVYQHQGQVDAEEFYVAADKHLDSSVMREQLRVLRTLLSTKEDSPER